MPVVFKHELHSVVFDAEHIVRWLQTYRLADPVTNQEIARDLAVNVLMPYRLAHCTDASMLRTEKYLRKAGILTGAKVGELLPVYFLLMTHMTHSCSCNPRDPRRLDLQQMFS